MAFKIESIWAYVSEDEKGEEGICGFNDPRTNQWIPMIAADETRLKSLKPFAHQIAIVTKRKVKLVKFSIREDMGEIV
jgi:hypothetical protein